jgi:hypothetical protein
MRVEAQLSYAELVWREPFGVAETPAEYVFHRPKLYLDTTIPSYLAARVSRDATVAHHQRVTSRWWNSWRPNFDIRISGHVWLEAAGGDPEAADRRLRLLEHFPKLEFDTRSVALQARLMSHCGLPPRATVDAAHVAIAAVHGMQFLLTWNFAHLVNPHFESKIQSICESESYICPVLCTPEQLLERYEYAYTRQ